MIKLYRNHKNAIMKPQQSFSEMVHNFVLYRDVSSHYTLP